MGIVVGGFTTTAVVDTNDDDDDDVSRTNIMEGAGKLERS
jgi:hypothetical protein